MIRALGFLLGVCLTVAALLMTLGPPTSEQTPVHTQGAAKTTAEQLSTVVAAIAEQVDAPPADSESEQLVLRAPESGAVEDQARSGIDANGLYQQPAAGQAEPDTSDGEDSGTAGTYVFWSPFRSEWAARGFAGRLTSATEVTVEVVKAGRGEYRVALSYRDEAERLARISRIETVTGLSLE